MRGWFESTFGAGALAAIFIIALSVVIVLFAIIAAFARRRNNNAGPAQGRGRQPRLAVMDMANVDDRRKLILIRRDNVEHLVMIGGPSDLVVESAIMRNLSAVQAPAPQNAERAQDRAQIRATDRTADRAQVRAADRRQDRPAAGPATPAHFGTQTRAQIRPPSPLPAGPEAVLASGSRPKSGNGPDDGAGEVRTAPPVHSSPQFVNLNKPPEAAREEKMPSQARAGPASPAAAPAQPAQTSSQPVSSAAVAGLAAGAAALTAAAASAKRHEPSPESGPETPPQKPAEAPAVLPAGPNGSEDQAVPSTSAVPDTGPDTGPDAVLDTGPDTVTPESAAAEPVVSADATKAANEAEAEKVAESAPEPAPEPVSEPVTATAVTNGATPGTDTGATTESEQKPADETPHVEAPVTEPVAAVKLAQAKGAVKTGETSADESQPQDAVATSAAPAADETSPEDDLEAAFAAVLTQPQDQSGESPETLKVAAAPASAEPVEAAPEPIAAASDMTAATAAQALPEATAGLPPARSLEEIRAESEGDPDIVTPQQADLPASSEPETVAAPGDTGADTADKTAEPAPEQPAAVSPFPSIPEDVRRSVLEAARRAERLSDATSRPAAQAGMADGGEKTTLGDLAERLEKALAKQASSLSGQLKPAADAKPASGPAQTATDSIEAWERGELTRPGEQAADAAPQAAPAAEPEATPEEQPRQSQAMLEDETDPSVIDFSDRKKASPDSEPSDSLEDEMARLLGELTDATSGR